MITAKNIKAAAIKNTIKPVGIVKALSGDALCDLACEVLEWHKTGKTEGLRLAQLSAELVSDSGIFEEGAMQVTEGLVMREVLSRWVAESILKKDVESSVSEVGKQSIKARRHGSGNWRTGVVLDQRAGSLYVDFGGSYDWVCASTHEISN